MGLRIMHGDVLDAQADALILTIDRASSRKELKGDTASTFARRWPAAWQEVEDMLRLPVPLGTAVDIEPSEDCPFRLVLLVSILVHPILGHTPATLGSQDRKGMVRSALEEAVKFA